MTTFARHHTFVAGILGLAAVALALPLTASAKPGDLVVADFFADKVVRIDVANHTRKTLAKGPEVASASYVTFLADGRLVFTDEEKPAIFDVSLPGNTPNPLVTEDINSPYGIAPDPQGRLIVVDYGPGKLLRVNPANGNVDPIVTGGWDASPYGVAVDPRTGVMYVTDSGDGVIKVTPNGTQTPLATGPPFVSPWGITRAPDGTLYVGDSGAGKVFSVNPKTGDVDTIAPAHEAYGLVVGLDGMIYASDYGADKVRRIKPATGAVKTVVRDLHSPVGVTIEPPSCLGKLAVSFYGTNAADTMRGSRYGDVFATLSKGDKIVAGNGPDRACGGAGADRIKVKGGGKDRVSCGPGRDRVEADGRDVIAGDCEVVKG